jgi:hypothetical protein
VEFHYYLFLAKNSPGNATFDKLQEKSGMPDSLKYSSLSGCVKIEMTQVISASAISKAH